MDLSKRDKDRLRKLAELYERDDLSDDEYRSQYNSILQNSRGTSELNKIASQGDTIAAGLPVIEESDLDPPPVESELKNPTQELQTAELPLPDVKDQPQQLEEEAEPEKSLLAETLELAKRDTADAAESNPIVQTARTPEEEKSKPTVALQNAVRNDRGFGGNRDRQDSIIRPPSSAYNPAVTGSTSRYKQVGHSSARIRRRGGLMTKLLVVPAVFGFGIVVALAVGYARSMTNDAGARPKTPVNPVVGAAIDVPVSQPVELFVKPLFGSLAIERCAERCNSNNWNDPAAFKACNRGCKRLNLTAYGRRITVKPLDAKQDAERIAFDCLRQPINVPRFDSLELWQAKTRQAMDSLFQAAAKGGDTDKLGASKVYYKDILRSHEQLRLPPISQVEKDPLTESLIRTTCLRTQLALTEVALGLVQERNDEFSWEFYRKLHQTLKPRVIDAESQLENAAVKQGLR